MEDKNLIERRESEKRTASLKKTTGILIAVAVVLAVVLAVVWIERSSLVKELNAEKDDLTREMIALKNDYANLSSDYENINMQLDSSREEVSQLIARIQKTEATNRAKIRQYERELGTLKDIMRSYIVQIDSLNTLNKQLTADAAAARKEAAESKRQNAELTKTVEVLEGQVAVGAAVKGRDISVDAYNASDKVTDRSSRVVRVMATLSLVENELAPKGPMKVYMQVKDPDGVLLTNASSADFKCAGKTLKASAAREIDYQGSEVELSIYLNDIPEYHKGVYTVEIFTEKGSIGTAELMLR